MKHKCLRRNLILVVKLPSVPSMRRRENRSHQSYQSHGILPQTTNSSSNHNAVAAHHGYARRRRQTVKQTPQAISTSEVGSGTFWTTTLPRLPVTEGVPEKIQSELPSTAASTSASGEAVNINWPPSLIVMVLPGVCKRPPLSMNIPASSISRVPDPRLLPRLSPPALMVPSLIMTSIFVVKL